MLKRVIPLLLVDQGELIKTVNFKHIQYIGDLLNSVKIYNELEVDELCILDRSAREFGIDFKLLTNFVDECFAPVSYGGGIVNLKDIEKVLKLGVEKVVVSSKLMDYRFVMDAVRLFGSSTIAACIDYKDQNGWRMVYSENGKKNESLDVNLHLSKLNEIGVGEIILHSIDRDGTYSGYDLELLKLAVKATNSPIVMAGGCKDLKNISLAFESGASGVVAGSLFVYYTNARGILINYPDADEFSQAQIKR